MHGPKVRKEGAMRPAVARPRLLRSMAMADLETPTHTDLVEALDAATRAVAGLLPVDDALQVIVDQVRWLVRAQYAALGIVDDHGVIERFVTSGIEADTRHAIGSLPRGHGILGLIIEENRAFRIPDLNEHPRRYGFPPNHPPMRSFLGVPVVAKGRSVGNLYLTNKDGGDPFSPEDEILVASFARHAGIAIENARLHELVQQLAILDERQRISSDLHDGIIQSIYAVGLSLEDVPELMDEDREEAARRVERAIDSLHLTIRDIRNFIFGLRPELLEGASLSAGLAAIVEEFRHNAVVDVELRMARPTVEPSPETTANLLAIVNEALSNVARHAGASQVVVTMTGGERGELTIEIADNGRGFDLATGAGVGHQGLANMRARSMSIGATMTIESEPASGTTVRLRLPSDTPEEMA